MYLDQIWLDFIFYDTTYYYPRQTLAYHCTAMQAILCC